MLLDFGFCGNPLDYVAVQLCTFTPPLLAEKPCNLRHSALIDKIFFAFVFLFHNAHPPVPFMHFILE